VSLSGHNELPRLWRKQSARSGVSDDQKSKFWQGGKMNDTPYLVMTQGPQSGQTFQLDKDVITIGRDPHNDIVIEDPQVSRQHARITVRGSLTIIEDAGSTNGTFVDGVRLTAPHTLADGNVVGLGDAVTMAYHGPALATTEPMAGRPTIPLAQPGHEPTMVIPPSSSPPPPPPPPPPAFVPPSSPSYAVPPAPIPDVPPPPVADEYPPSQRSGKTWLFAGCGCLLLLIVLACVAVFVLDHLGVLPPIFYEPLYWLGLDQFFIP